MNFIVDLDGTITNDAQRQHLVNQDPVDWDCYHRQGVHDSPVRPIIRMLQVINRAPAYNAEKNRIEIWTGRSDITKDDTIRWLRKYGVPYDELRMREHGDNRDADVLKAAWYAAAPHINPTNTVVFDDRVTQAQWWRSLGFTCLDVAGHGY